MQICPKWSPAFWWPWLGSEERRQVVKRVGAFPRFMVNFSSSCITAVVACFILSSLVVVVFIAKTLYFISWALNQRWINNDNVYPAMSCFFGLRASATDQSRTNSISISRAGWNYLSSSHNLFCTFQFQAYFKIKYNPRPFIRNPFENNELLLPVRLIS